MASRFLPPHHLEGGAVNIVVMQAQVNSESIRDWGRDCWCPSGIDNSCGKRFGWQLGDLPAGYDHKYAIWATILSRLILKRRLLIASF